MQSCMSECDSVAFLVMFIPSFYLSLFVIWLCLDSRSPMIDVVQVCTVFSCCIDASIVIFFVASVISSLHTY